jgi:predicted nucleic acid-binding Zn ribbon protein
MVMENIKDIVKTVIGNIAQRNPDAEYRAERIWEKIIAENERKHTKVAGIKEEVLFVHVDSPAWLHHMRTRQNSIFQRLSEEIPGIKQIRFKMGKTK